MPRKCATGPHQGWQPDPHSPRIKKYINDGLDEETRKKKKIKDPALETKISYEMSKSGDTQVPNTIATYRKVMNKHFKNVKGSNVLDYGAGLGVATREFGLDSFEPYSKKGFEPKYTDPSQITKKYKGIIANAVLNVLPLTQRTEAVKNIGNLLAVGGKAVIMARSKSTVESVKNPEAYEDGHITTRGTFQKGFTQKELIDFVKSILGPDFLVTSSPLGDIGVLVTKLREAVEVESYEDAREYGGVMDVYRDVGMSPGDFI